MRGNAPGEWRYWGADAWSTRYSPLDQINASNFSKLQVAWRWNAAVDGDDEVLPDDAALRERPDVHRGDDATLRLRDRPGDGHDDVVVEDWRKAFASRRRRASSPAAGSPTGPTAAATNAWSS